MPALSPQAAPRPCTPNIFDQFTVMQVFLNIVPTALALDSAAFAAPVHMEPWPTFMPGPVMPDESYTGYNPLKAAVTTTEFDKENLQPTRTQEVD